MNNFKLIMSETEVRTASKQAIAVTTALLDGACVTIPSDQEYQDEIRNPRYPKKLSLEKFIKEKYEREKLRAKNCKYLTIPSPEEYKFVTNIKHFQSSHRMCSVKT